MAAALDRDRNSLVDGVFERGDDVVFILWLHDQGRMHVMVDAMRRCRILIVIVSPRLLLPRCSLAEILRLI